MQTLKRFINKNIILFIIAITVFVVGVVGGVFVSSNISPKDSNELTAQLSYYLSVNKTGNLNFGDIFMCECINHLRFVPLMLLFSLSTLFIVPGCFMLAVRGYQLGFAVSFVCSHFGKNGIFITLICAILSYIVTIPVYLTLFVLSVSHALQSKSFGTNSITFRGLLVLFLIAYTVLCMAAGIEGILLPIFIDFLN